MTSAVLDDVLPAYRHRERHGATIAAPPERVWDALHAVTVRELALTRVLMAARALPARLTGRGDAFNEDAAQTFMRVMAENGFTMLRDDPSALVAGSIGRPWQLRRESAVPFDGRDGFRAFGDPGYVLMATSFECEPDAGGTRLCTETRVQPTDESAARSFRPYWLAIRAGSGLIRREILRAVRRRAERLI
ncbi:MAG: hypothetical protein AB7V42_05215 [Thermoleophilia bacterium]